MTAGVSPAMLLGMVHDANPRRAAEEPPRGRAAEPAESPSPDTLLDLTALSEIRGFQMPDGPDVVATVIAMFAAECPVQLQRLGAAIARQDPVDLREVAHSVKGSAAVIGALEVRLLCQQLEDLGAAGTVVGAASLTRALERATERACAALAKLGALGE